MSLINQMLQELDARRSEVTGSDTYGQQIRVVQERQRIHPAWWIALVLAIVSCGLIAWVLLRPPVAAPAHSTGAQLPLKLDADHKVGARAAPALAPVEPEKPVEQPAAGLVPKPAEAPRQDVPPVVPQLVDARPARPATAATASAMPIPATSQAEPARPAKVAAKEVNEPSVPALIKVVPPAKSLLKTPAAKVPESTAPVINKQITELSPQQRAENEYRKAISALQQGKSSEAIGSLELALQLDPRHVGARHALVGALLDSQRSDDALRIAGEGLSADPAQPGLAMIVARLQLDKGDARKAIETLERTLVYASDRADYQAFMAALLQRNEQHKQAAEHYLQALQKSPQNGVWWMGLGISLQAERRSSEAQEAFKRAKATHTLSPELTAFVDSRLSQLQR